MATSMTPDASPGPQEEDLWTDNDWEGLLLAITHHQCTPFLGAGASVGVLPLGGQVALEWANQYDYPFDDRTNLPRVAQYIAVNSGANTPRFKIIGDFNKRIEEQRANNFPFLRDPSNPHRIAADLELPLYITTNYDSFMFEALKRSQLRTLAQRAPRKEVCNWRPLRQRLKVGQTPPDNPPILEEPTPENPVVYHLHGSLDDANSLVLTEDDYLDFLVFMSENPGLVSSRLQEAFANTALLFLGYSLEDLNFKVLLRQLSDYMQRVEGSRHVSVQLAPLYGETDQELKRRAERQRAYLEEKYKLQRVKVYWGSCDRFAREMRRKWDATR